MASDTVNLPPGFTLDSAAPSGPSLPVGFKLDGAAPDKPGFVASTLSKTADKMSLNGVLSTLAEADHHAGNGDFKQAFSTLLNLVPNPKAIYESIKNDVQHGNASDIASDVIPLAFAADTASGGKLSGAVSEGADSAATLASRVADNSRAVTKPLTAAAGDAASSFGGFTGALAAMGHPGAALIKAAGAVAKGGNLKAAVQGLSDLLKPSVKEDIADKLASRPAYTGPDMMEKIAADQAKPVSSDISTNVKISPKISVESASSAEGTTPSAPVPVSANLDAPTTQRLATATQDGTANGLTRPQKADLVKAVRAGDADKVNDILDNHAGVRNFARDVENKVAVLARYFKDHNIDPDNLDPADYQKVADAAVTHAKTLENLTTPRAGKYKGISADTMNAVKQSLR